MTDTPASIRNKNPGAQWPSKTSKKFGSTSFEKLADGNKIATFNDYVSGAAALFDLLRVNYVDLTIASAIAKWSGGNNVDSYLKMIKSKAGLSAETVLDVAFLETPSKAVSFAKAMAWHEAGQKYPMTDVEWAKAHAKAFPKSAPLAADLTPLEIMRSRIGMKEIAGKEDNQDIMQWYVDVDHPEVEHDEVPNCAASVGSALKRGSMKHLSTLSARDYTNYGPKLTAPEVGAIGVQWRVSRNSWEGHVGIIDEFDGDYVWMIASNEEDETKRTKYRYTGASSKFLGFYRPIPVKKSLWEVAQRKSILTGATTIGGIIVAGLTNTVDWVVSHVVSAGAGALSLVGALPTAFVKAGEQIEPVQNVALRLGLPVPLQVTLIMSIVAIAIMMFRHGRDVQEN